jgi:hypothetical protein
MMSPVIMYMYIPRKQFRIRCVCVQTQTLEMWETVCFEIHLLQDDSIRNPYCQCLYAYLDQRVISPDVDFDGKTWKLCSLRNNSRHTDEDAKVSIKEDLISCHDHVNSPTKINREVQLKYLTTKCEVYRLQHKRVFVVVYRQKFRQTQNMMHMEPTFILRK